MLQDIRDNSQGLISKIIIGAIIAIFALFGAESLIGGFTRLPAVAEINGEEITDQRLQQESQRLLASIGGNLDALDQGLLEQIALNQIIEETVLRQSATDASMVVSSDRLDRAILENPNFQINGVFDAEFAARTMQSQFFSIPLYREELSKQMVLSQLVSGITATNFVTETELGIVAELSAQTRDFRYVSIPMGARTLGTPVADEEIEAYYQENQDDYQVAATVAVEYVVLDKATIAAELQVDEELVRAQYEAEKASYEGSAEKRASHILLEVGDDEADTVALANTIKERLDAGESFADLALEFSVDTVSAEQGGDIGFTDGSTFPEAVEEALNVLSLNEVSGPVVSDFGVHLVMLTQDQVNVFQAFEEVAGRIENELKAADIEQIYAERLEDLSNLAFESEDLSQISEQLGLSIIESDAFSASGGPGLFSNQSLVSAAFSDDVLDGNNSDVIETGAANDQAVVLRFKEYTDATISPLDELRGEIAVAIRSQMERQAVQELGDELLSAAESGEDITAKLEENELSWVDGIGTARTAVNVNRQVLNQLFSMESPEEGQTNRSAISLDNGTFVLIELNAVNPGQISSLADAEKENLSSTLREQGGGSDFQNLLANLRENADIVSSRLTEEL